jgi:cell division protein FtsQ
VNRYSKGCHAGNRGFVSGLLPVIVLFLVAVGGITWVSMGIVANDRWPIRWLDLNGAFQRVSAEQLRGSITPLINESFFTIDLQELRDATSRISWVSAVRVQKRWPDKIVVTIEEFVPIAHWNRGQLISEKGETFSVREADGIQGLPWLQGPQERLDEVLSNWTEFSDLLVPKGLEISQLKLDRRGAWAMQLSNGTHLQLGREAARERLQRLLASWDSLMQEKAAPPQDIDLRYTNGFAVSWPQDLDTDTRTDS